MHLLVHSGVHYKTEPIWCALLCCSACGGRIRSRPRMQIQESSPRFGNLHVCFPSRHSRPPLRFFPLFFHAHLAWRAKKCAETDAPKWIHNGNGYGQFVKLNRVLPRYFSLLRRS